MKSVLIILISFLSLFASKEVIATRTNLWKKNPQNDAEKNAMPVFMRQSPQWALEKIETMTLEERIAQSFMVEVTPNKGEEHLAVIDSLVSVHKIGGIIMFQGTVENTKSAIERFQNKSETPLLVGIDGEWGSNMRLSDGERTPFQLTMGAADQLQNTRTIAQGMGMEMNELGIHINFSPVVDVNTNPTNPVIGFRAFGENPLTVSNHSLEMIKGMQEYNVLTSMKHFPGHGDTDIDSHLDLPVINKSRKDLERVDWLPYRQGKLVGASAIMVGHISVPALDESGLAASISPKIIKEVIREELNFEGLIISDALNMKALTKRYGDVEIVKRAYIAGNDILLYPSRVAESIQAIKLAVERGEISEQEVNEKAIRVLRAKFWAMDMEGTKVTPKVTKEQVEYAKINVYEKALVVIKNENVIPIKDASGKSLILNLGAEGNSFNDMASYYINAEVRHYATATEADNALRGEFGKYDRIFINFIAKSVLPKNEYSYPEGWRVLLRNMPQKPEVFVTIFGNPYGVKDRHPFENVDAVILGFQNSEIGQNRAVQLMFGSFQATSRLPITLSIDYQEGFGLVTAPATRLKYTVPMELGISAKAFDKIDSIALNGIKQGAYPGAQIVVAKDGKIVYQKSFGYQTYENKVPIDNHTIWDLASITKIAASTFSLMNLQSEDKFNPDNNLGDYLGDLTEGTVYNNMKLKNILTHQARLIPWIPFYKATLVNGKPDPELYSTTPEGNKTAVVTSNLYLDASYEEKMYEIILGKELRKQSGYKYSDLGLYFVKSIVEKQSGRTLDEFTLNKFYLPMGLPTMGFNPTERFDYMQMAPTEEDKYYRYERVQGYVHDMGAAMQGGVGGHAGLFSNAANLAGYMQMLLNKGEYGGIRYINKEVVEEYTKCQFCPSNRRGLGFDKNSASGDGPAHPIVPQSSFGHTGFTGTIAWADPVNNINYVFLSNRTYPDQENKKLMTMNVRTDIQKVIYDIFKK